MVYECSIVDFEDILIYSPSFDEHVHQAFDHMLNHYIFPLLHNRFPVYAHTVQVSL